MSERDEVTYLRPADLETHPRNMRRFYPQADVDRMAASIRERGVIQPLAVCRADAGAEPGRYWVVAGNLRLAAIRQLDGLAPETVPVIIRERDEADQLMDMAVENVIQFDPDPISEGLHYRRILAQPGMSLNKLCKQTGISAVTIKTRLAWAELEPEIQEFGMRGRLPLGAADHLIKLPAGKRRVQIARDLVNRRVSRLDTIERVVNRELAAKDEPITGPHGPAVAMAQYRPAAQAYRPDGRAAAGEEREAGPEIRSPVRQAAAEACALCPTRDDLGVPEPAWSILSHGARETCEACPLNDIRESCINCPLVVALRFAYRAMAREEGLIPHRVF